MPGCCLPSFHFQWAILPIRPVQTGDMKRRPGNGIEGAMVCTSLDSLLRPLFYFLDDVSYPQSVLKRWMLVDKELRAGVIHEIP